MEEEKLKLRSTYVYHDSKWKRKMQYFSKINLCWEDLNDIDFYHLKIITS